MKSQKLILLVATICFWYSVNLLLSCWFHVALLEVSSRRGCWLTRAGREEGTNTFDFVATLLLLERLKGRSQWGHVKMLGGIASNWKLLQLYVMLGLTKLLEIKYFKAQKFKQIIWSIDLLLSYISFLPLLKQVVFCLQWKWFYILLKEIYTCPIPLTEGQQILNDLLCCLFLSLYDFSDGTL